MPEKKKRLLSAKKKLALSLLVPFVLLLGYVYVSHLYLPVERSGPREQNEPAAVEDDLLPESAGAGEGQSAEAEAEVELPPELEQDLALVHGVIARGDTVGNLLQAWLTVQEIGALDAVCKSVHPLQQIKIGQDYVVVTKDEAFVSFEYEIDDDHKLVASRTENGFAAQLVNIAYDLQLHRVSGVIRSNLFNSMTDCGEKPALAAALADVFAWEINFIRDLREGDEFSLLVEKRYRNGEFKGYGKLLAAFFDNQNNHYEAFLFRDGVGQSQYYTSDGQSVRRAFLKAPLSFTRISSGYSHNRLHPVTMDWKAHPAIDYAAPTGTPVKTVGKGTVSYMGYSKSAGNYITIEHLNDYQTMYLHLSAFAKGLRKGDKVVQGQVIGFVGRTGYATGPHLDFRMKKEGRYINPLSISSPRDTPVSQPEFPSFQQQIRLYMDFMEEKKELAEYRPEELKI